MRIKKQFCLAALWAITIFWAVAFVALAHAGVLPDPVLTPGVTRDVTVQTLCTTSTKAVRHTTAATKAAVYKEYGITPRHSPKCTGPGHSCYEIDHLLSLEDGGADDAKNLWPQIYDGPCNAHMKDQLENYVHRAICKKQMTIPEAQALLLTDWVASYRKYIGPLECGK
ncbi:MAG: hypothetical protein ABIT70_10950 [Sulfuriferula sp.]